MVPGWHYLYVVAASIAGTKCCGPCFSRTSTHSDTTSSSVDTVENVVDTVAFSASLFDDTHSRIVDTS
jgi:hypothetical protein